MATTKMITVIDLFHNLELDKPFKENLSPCGKVIEFTPEVEIEYNKSLEKLAKEKNR
jgi:hypothetical protein